MRALTVTRLFVAMRALAATLALALVAAAAAVAPVRPADGGSPWTADETAQLRTAIDMQLVAAPTLRGAHVGIVVRDPRDGTVLYAKNADDYVRPASTMKLLTGSFALDTLGPTYRFRSSVELAGYGEGATFSGAVIVHGGNNPFLTTDDFTQAARNVIAAFGADGIRTFAAGDAIAPVGHANAVEFDDPPTGTQRTRAYRDGWTSDDYVYAYAPPLGPIVVDENAIRVTVAPHSAIAVVAPDIGKVEDRCSEPLFAAYRAVDARFASIARYECDALRLAFLDAPTAQTWHLANPDPARYVRSLFEDALKRAQVRRTTIPDARENAPPGATTRTIWQSASPALGEVLRRCWYPSNNLIAEKLLDEGVRSGRVAASSTDAESAFQSELAWAKAKPGLALTDDRVADGSGMSQYDRLTANELAAILAYDWKSPNRNVVLDALPVAAVSGTLESQYVGTPIAGHAFAKSGSMLHTSNLAGYLATKNHGTVIFAFMVDDWVGDDDDLLPLRGAILGRFVDAP
jgi:D-alanyl-D-alanine carboxypeptidase/D-alanyl-D-alanine-endopeptidase (penicillin-binding protein 4)